MITTVEMAVANGVGIGAHPGYFDRENFGRHERAISPDEAASLVMRQVEQLHDIAGEGLRHVKLHGALYHQVSADAALAGAVAGALARSWPKLALFALSGSALAQAGRARGLGVAEEVFADRTYQHHGRLTPRTEPGALITEESVAIRQVLRMVQQGVVRATDGSDWRIRADTVCLHGDGANAVPFARRLRAELTAAGVTLRRFAA
jgi:UPF0271 protein